jgi:hypothetical protein
MAYKEVELKDSKDECRGRNGWFVAKKALVGLTGAFTGKGYAEIHIHLMVESQRSGKNYPIDISIEKAEAVKVAQAILKAAGLTEYRLLVVKGDVKPELRGLFESEDARDSEAKRYRKEDDPGMKDGLYALDIVAGEPRVDSYSGGFFEEAEEPEGVKP